jgi:hypothetical protein
LIRRMNCHNRPVNSQFEKREFCVKQ